MILRQHSDILIRESIAAVMPGEAVKEALCGREFVPGRLILIAIGKAAWSMADAAMQRLAGRVDGGMVITKYGHSRGTVQGLAVREAGHPVADMAGYNATEEALRMTEGLCPEDTVLFLVSGGGSALFESPAISPEEAKAVGERLLLCGASIDEINALRKRLSRVKGGRFAAHCAPAKVVSVLLSDVLSNRPDVIASGPCCVDESSVEEALQVVDKYQIPLSPQALEALKKPLPQALPNVENHITGSVRHLCRAAAVWAERLGYKPVFLTDALSCEAREAGAFFGSIALSHQDARESLAFIAGGETVVHVKGNGKGGRNQELALAAVEALSHCRETLLFSVGSDGTDGPTDAAGGRVDNHTLDRLKAAGICPETALNNNDAYTALGAVDGLIFTGPTGTNVNDLTVLLIRR